MGALGLLLAALGAILERHAKIIKKSMPKMIDFDSQKGGQREAKSNPKRSKIEDKNRYEKNTSSRSSWSRFETILGCFLTTRDLKNVVFSLVFKSFREKSLFSKDIASRAVLDRTWPDLGRFWLPFWHLFGAQNGHKTMLKTHQKTDAIFDRFLIENDALDSET